MKTIFTILLFVTFSILHCQWSAVVYQENGAITNPIAFDPLFVQSGQLGFHSNAIPSSYNVFQRPWAHFTYSDTLCTDGNFEMEFRAQNSLANGGYEGCDIGFRIFSPQGDIFINTAKQWGTWATHGQYYFVEVAGTRQASIAQLQIDWEQWHTIKLTCVNQVCSLFVDNVFATTFNYNVKVCQFTGYALISKGSGGRFEFAKFNTGNSQPLYDEQFDASFPANFPDCQNPSISLSTNAPICEGEDLVIDINEVVNNISNYNNIWTGPIGFTTNTSDSLIFINASSQRTGWYKVTSFFYGCEYSKDSIFVDLKTKTSSPNLTSSNPVCIGSPLQISASLNYDTYYWLLPDGSSLQTSNINITSATASNFGIYKLTVKNNSECQGDTVQITIQQSAKTNTPNISGNSVCEGLDLNLMSSNPSDNYFWIMPNGINSQSSNISVINASTQNQGVYSLQVKDNDKCISDITTLNIQVYPKPSTPTISSNLPICTGSTFNITAVTNEPNVLWITNNVLNGTTNKNINVNNVTDNYQGTYQLIATSINNCHSDTAISNISFTNKIIPSFSYVAPKCLGDPLILQTETTSYPVVWSGPNFSSNEVSTQVLSPQSGVYTLLVGDNQCKSDLISMDLNFNDLQSETYYLPNVITPNNDNINDKIILPGLNNKDYNFTIFNRWGNQVFESNKPLDSWDGTINGTQLMEGVYFYTFQYRNCREKLTKQTNSITILR